MRSLRLATLFLVALTGASAQAGEFSTSGDQRWIVYSTEGDLERAIAMARRFSNGVRNAVAMKQADGRFAIVGGPVAAPDPDKAIQEEMKRWFTPPPSPKLSRGDEFVGKAWQFVDPVIARAETTDKEPKAVRLTAGDLEIAIEPRTDRKRDLTPTAVSVTRNGAKLFAHLFDEDDYIANGAVSVVRLTPGAESQVVFTHFSGGPHCCTDTLIATPDAQGRWRGVEAGSSERGYSFEDLDGDGVAEMIGVDEGMLYAFSSYAGSNPPPRVKKLVNGAVRDVTFDPAYRRYMRQQLYIMESNASEADWKQNGWLAGWVAMKIIAGEGADGWARMLEKYDREDPASIERCRVKAKVDECPSARRRFIDAKFPDALRDYLFRHGYPLTDIPRGK